MSLQRDPCLLKYIVSQTTCPPLPIRSTPVPHTHPNPQGPAPLNAISPQTAAEDADRRANHLAVCQEIIDLGMMLTRAAAQRALEAAEHPTQEPAQTPNTPQSPPRDPNLPFARTSRIVLRAVALSAQIAAGAFNRAPPGRATASGTQSDAELHNLHQVVNRDLVMQGLERLTETHPNRQALQDTIEDAVDDTLADHPEDPPPPTSPAPAKSAASPDLILLPDHLAESLAPETPANLPIPVD